MIPRRGAVLCAMGGFARERARGGVRETGMFDVDDVVELSTTPARKKNAFIYERERRGEARRNATD